MRNLFQIIRFRLGVEIKPNITISEVIYSTSIAIIVMLMLASGFSNVLIKPLTYDGTLVRSGRYSFSFEAWDSISQYDEVTIVAVGSSLTQYGFNGSCIGNQNPNNNEIAFNLGVPGSYPYLDMIQTERAINSDPDLIIIEINPINLAMVSGIPENNVQLRFTLGSLHLKASDYGDWQEILTEEHAKYIDGIFDNRYNSESLYFDDSLEEMITRYIDNQDSQEWWNKERHWYLSTPHPSDQEWEGYLSDPTLLSNYLSQLSDEERSTYENETIPSLMQRNRYKPDLEDNLNFEALEYMISRFSESEIPTLLLSYPIHPLAMDALEASQLDQHNTSISRLQSYEEVSALNLMWQNNFTKSDFYDYEHLNWTGRQKMCSIISNEIRQTDFKI